jgi:NADPH:quinone reductase-like Zn-dependent oxidoreductase
MKQVQILRYGGVDGLELVDAPDPEPGRGEIVVGVRAVGVNPKDVMVRKGRFKILTGKPPITLGHDVAGEVLAAGPGAELRVGERVYGMINHFSGRAYAERAVVKDADFARMPASLSFEEAAAIPLAAQTALQALRDLARVRAGHRVVIHGASGGVGTYAVQIAADLGAEVTATSSAKNRELCLSLGAHHHVDYREREPSSLEGPFDCFFDVFGNQRFAKVAPTLGPKGIYINTIPNQRVFGEVAKTLFSAKRARLVVVRSKRGDLDVLSEMVERGALRPILAETLPFQEFREAHRLIETRRTVGKIVLRLG